MLVRVLQGHLGDGWRETLGWSEGGTGRRGFSILPKDTLARDRAADQSHDCPVGGQTIPLLFIYFIFLTWLHITFYRGLLSTFVLCFFHLLYCLFSCVKLAYLNLTLTEYLMLRYPSTLRLCINVKHQLFYQLSDCFALYTGAAAHPVRWAAGTPKHWRLWPPRAKRAQHQSRVSPLLRRH